MTDNQTNEKPNKLKITDNDTLTGGLLITVGVLGGMLQYMIGIPYGAVTTVIGVALGGVFLLVARSPAK